MGSNIDRVVSMIKTRLAAEGDDHSVPACRRGFQDLIEKLTSVASDVQHKNIDAGGVSSEWLSVPESRTNHVLFYLHGGGYIVGSPETHRDLISRMARAAKMHALVPDYRLAPEHPFPAQLDDSVAAYQWLIRQGYPAENIVFAGESSGAAQVIATLLMLKEKRIPLPAAAICISGMLDLLAVSHSFVTNSSVDPSVNRDRVLRLAKLYIGDRDPLMPLASPMYADLTGLPPLLIQVGSIEVLLDDSIRLAQSAREAGVETQLDVWYGMLHAWHLYAPMLPEGQQAIIDAGKFAQKHTQR